MSLIFARGAARSNARLSHVRALASGTDIPEEADVVVVGGGSIGASTAFHLAERGLKTVLLEKHQYTSGTTWHTAGMHWSLRPSDTDVELNIHTKKMCLQLEEETGLQSWTQNGGLFIACNEERLREYQRMSTLGIYFDTESQVLSPAEAQEIYPLLSIEGVHGAVYSPTDGTIDPASIVPAYVKAAKSRGAVAVEGVGVSAVETEAYETAIGSSTRRVTGVVTDSGVRIRTGAVVNACGAWANGLAELAGVRLPLRAMKHAYVVTEGIEGVNPSLPNVRDHDLSVYFKTQGDSLGIGGYEQNPEFWDDVDGGFSYGLFDLDWDTFGQNLEGHLARVPAIETVGIKSTVCGPESFTPDHKPLCGPQPGLRGFYNACGMNSMGMMLGGGIGREMATWVATGSPDLDMFSMDCARFHPDTVRDARWVKDRTHESYAKTYAIVFPHDEALAGRGARKSALHDMLLEEGCVYQARHGFERPGWFDRSKTIAAVADGEAEGAPPLAVGPYDYYGAYADGGWRLEEGHADVLARDTPHPYLEAVEGDLTFGWPKNHEAVAEESHAARNGVAVFDQSYFGKFYLEGPRAVKAVRWICAAGAADKPVGTTTYTPLCNSRGGVEADLTVTRVAEDSFYFAAGGNTATKDFEWISQRLRDVCPLDGAEYGEGCTFEDRTEEMAMISVQGPFSRATLQPVVSRWGGGSDALSEDALPFSSHRRLDLPSNNSLPDMHTSFAELLRLTFVGELGYELHVPSAHAPAILAAVMESAQAVQAAAMANGSPFPVRHAGYRAIDSLSAEKGYRHWHADLSNRDTPMEAGIGFTVLGRLKIGSCESDNFLGRGALEEKRAQGLKRKLICLTLDDTDVPLHGLETIWRDGACVGYVRSTAFGHTVGRTIAYGYVDLDHVSGEAEPVPSKITNKWLQRGTYSIDSQGVQHAASLSIKAPFDPTNKRVRGEYEL